MKIISLIAVLALLLSCGIARHNYLHIGGEGRPEWKRSPLSLEEKAAFFLKDLDRFLPPEGHLQYRQHAQGDFRYMPLADVPTWHGSLMGTEAFRYAVTRDPAALASLKRLAGGMEVLHEVTGVQGLLARNAVPAEGPGIPVPGMSTWLPGTGRYRDWKWKGDTSRDQYSGALFGLYLAWKHGDASLRKRMAALARSIADHFLENDFYLCGPDGEPTTYGNLHPTIWGVPIGVNALITLTALKLAALTTGEEKYFRAYRDKIGKGWHRKTRWAKFQVLGVTNHNNDNMAVMCLYPILSMEEDPEIRGVYHKALERLWSYVYREGNSYFNFTAAAFGLGGELAIKEARITLELFPVDKRNLTFDHEEDERFETSWMPNRKGRAVAKFALPINYRSPSSFAWKTCPYELSRHMNPEGTFIYAGQDYLLAYWMGRYHGFLDAGEAKAP